MYKIPIAIYKDEGNPTYGVVIPDVSGCYPCGNSIDEAIEDSRVMIIEHATYMLEENISFDLSKVRTIEELKKHPDFQDVLCWEIVGVEETAIPTKRE